MTNLDRDKALNSDSDLSVLASSQFNRIEGIEFSSKHQVLDKIDSSIDKGRTQDSILSPRKTRFGMVGKYKGQKQ
jgi:hypothetical protein